MPPHDKPGGPGVNERSQHIQVFVRCRPLNAAEKAARSFSVVDTPNSKEMTVKEKPSSSITKTFNFDRVFGPKSKQLDVYRSVVEPLIPQVMGGYNCTVFAYGQTGTGKTFTMEGGDGRDDPTVTWENDPTSGIIPRALAQLFDELRIQQEAEFSVRVSFLELYNEEIFDLLSATDDTTRLRLYEDSARKGSVIIQGLEEVQVHSKKEVYNILEKGSAKRMTAATLMNAHSSRSHTVFTVTVHMKESSVEGEEVLRIGKLNLVDLAGSENVGRSGAMDKRAREAGNINQSLLTLGRVITCLVERTPHIPYRESKLTRLLQDSLGGRTKTSIIATVSPAAINLEETLSTLDYAHRAKDIKNKPEVNQKLSKKAVLKEYTEEIERLRKDLMANREKNGVFLASENYQEMIGQIEMQSQEIAEKIGEMKALKEEMDKLENNFEEVSSELKVKTEELESTSTKLSETEHTLKCTRAVLHKTNTEKEEQEHLVSKHVETESNLTTQAKTLLSVADVSTKDLTLLHDKLERVKKMEASNKDMKNEFDNEFSDSVQNIIASMKHFGTVFEKDSNNLKGNIKSHLAQTTETLSSLSTILAAVQKSEDEAVISINKKVADYVELEKENLRIEDELNTKFVTKVEGLLENMSKQEIAKLVSAVKESLDCEVLEVEKFRTNLSTQVETLVQILIQFMGQTVDDLGSLKDSVGNYKKSTEERIAAIKRNNEVVKESDFNFGKLLANLVQSYEVHSQLMKVQLEDTDKLASNEKESVEKVYEETVNVISKFDERTKNATNLLETQKSRIIDDSNCSLDLVGKAVLEIRGNSDSILSSANGKVDEVKSEFQCNNARISSTKLAREENLINVKKNVETVLGSKRDEFRENYENLSLEVSSLTKSGQDNYNEVVDSVSELNSNVETQVESLMNRIGSERENVSIFVSEVLQEDKPSGRTPARAERSFPRFLAATSPHDRILAKFRSQAPPNENIAAKLPIGELDDDDSLISRSSSSSRRNSTGDFQGENGRSSAGGSKNSSRAASRQNSATNLKFGSTSDIGSEVDSENRDPQFRKPMSKQGAKGSKIPGRGPLNSVN